MTPDAEGPGPQCHSCGRGPLQDPGLPGWLIETRPTLGGGLVSIALCFPCRDLVPGARDRAVASEEPEDAW